MPAKVCGTLKYKNHDEFIIAYASRLSKGKARVRTPQALAAGEPVVIRVQVADEGTTIDIFGVVQSSTDDSGGGFTTRLLFTEESKQSLEEFILKNDPAGVAAAPVVQRCLKVAVVDDNDLQRQKAAAPFRARGDTVITATDGLGGLALCVEHEPDVVISDVQMPRIDGWQMLRMLRARDRLREVPVIFLTTLSSEKDRLHGYQLGVDDYLAKPFSPEILLAKVERVVKRAKVGVHSIAPTAMNALRGDLEHVSLPALMSFLELERKSGSLFVEPKGCMVVIREGRPIRARTTINDSADSGAQAVFDLLNTARGRFEFIPGDAKDADSVRMSLGAILMEHARLQDEHAAGRHRVGP